MTYIGVVVVVAGLYFSFQGGSPERDGQTKDKGQRPKEILVSNFGFLIVNPLILENTLWSYKILVSFSTRELKKTHHFS